MGGVLLLLIYLCYVIIGGECRAMAKWPPFPMNYMNWFPSELRGKAVPSTESLYSSQLSERDNRTPPSCRMAKSWPIRSFPTIKPIRDFPTIEPGTLQHHNTKSVLKFHS